MSLNKKCSSSQYLIDIEKDAYGHHYNVEVFFERPDKEKPIFLSQNNNNHYKALCRKAINCLDAFKNLRYVYDGCAQLWTPEALKEDIKIEIAQADLDDFLKLYLVDPNGKLHISLTNGATIMMSDFSDTVNAALIEDRSWRNLMELILSEDAITRDRNPFVMHGSGCLYEVEERPFHSGLVYREGHTKGVHIIKGKYGIPQMALAMDCCKKAFFPSNSNFREFLNNFTDEGRTFDEAEAMCWGLGLLTKNNSRQVLRFKNFCKHDGEICAVMKNSEEIFSLEDLEIVPDQSVQIDAMPKELKDLALNLNKFKPHDRKRFIEQQFQKLQLNNKITSAFGVMVKETMLEGEYENRMPVDIYGRNNEKLHYDKHGSFKSNNYVKPAQINKFILLSSLNDKMVAWQNFKKIAKLSTNKYGRQLDEILIFEEFDTNSTDPKDWINALSKYQYGNSNIMFVVDDVPGSHTYLKYAENVTGAITQHVKTSTISKCGIRTIETIVHQINIKMDGLNFFVKFANTKLDLDNNTTLILSADVCHPTSKSGNDPSFVALSANCIQDPQKFKCKVFAQESGQELIDQHTLTLTIEKFMIHLKEFREIKRIVYLRDGVSEGQYSMILKEEISAIKNAAKNCNIEVELLAFIITKDTNVRHFNEQFGRTESMPAGSFVNFGLRYGFDQFFMIAHQSYTGTSKSICVTKIFDEIGISLFEAQQFLYTLCSMHQICAVPISIPQPLKESDSTAYRAMLLFNMMKTKELVPTKDDGNLDYEKLDNMLNTTCDGLLFRYDS